MMPAIEDMVTREAMPAREAMRDNRGAVAGESRETVVEGNTLSSEFYAIIRGVLSHLPFKQNALGLATEGVPNSRKGGYPMRKLVISCHFTIENANPNHRTSAKSRFVCVKAVL